MNTLTYPTEVFWLDKKRREVARTTDFMPGDSRRVQAEGRHWASLGTTLILGQNLNHKGGESDIFVSDMAALFLM